MHHSDSFTDWRTPLITKKLSGKSLFEILATQKQTSSSLISCNGKYFILINVSFSWHCALHQPFIQCEWHVTLQKASWYNLHDHKARHRNRHKDLLSQLFSLLAECFPQGKKKVHIVTKPGIHQMLTLCVVVQLALYRLAAFHRENPLRFGEIH